MSGKKIITVFGATGGQGGSVVDIFLNDAKLTRDWQVRGVTRDASKDSAKKLASRGVEVVSADMNDTASLTKAMEDSAAVFAVTNYWEKMDGPLEIQQGRNLADAAKAAGVQHYIWSTLIDVSKETKGRLSKVHHFDGKAKVTEYVRTLGLPATFFMPGLYMSNFPGQQLRQPAAGEPWTLALPVDQDASRIPLFDSIADTGKFIKAIVLHRDSLLGKDVLGAAEYLTPRQMVDAFRAAFPQAGAEARYVRTPDDQFVAALKSRGMPDFVVEELLQNWLLLQDVGYYAGASLDESKALVEEPLTTWAEFVKTAPAFKGLK